MKYKLEDLIDIPMFQSLQDRLNEIYSFPSAIIDNNGNILTATGWQDICTKFHRVNKESAKECIKSDQYILDHIHEANPAVSYKCPHGLVDNATPIIIEGVHYGNFFTGQFFLEEPDLEFFKKQAKKYGFEEVSYLEAVKKVPIWTQSQLDNYIFLIKDLIEVISGMGLKNLKEIDANLKINENEEKFRRLIEQTNDGIIQVDNDDVIQFVNPRFCELLGYNEKELIGKIGYNTIISEEDKELIQEKNQTRTKGVKEHYELRMKKKNGEAIYFLMSASPVTNQDGAVIGSMSVCTDITERKKAEEELRRSQKFLQLSLENMLEGFAVHEAIFDDNGRMKDYKFLEFNAAAQKIAKVKREDIVGKTALELYPNINEQGLMQKYAEVMAKGQPINLEDFYYEGDNLDKAFVITCFKIDNNHFACVFRDITKRKNAEIELKKQHEFVQKIADTSPVGITVVDKTGQISFANPRAEEILGLNKDNIAQLTYNATEWQITDFDGKEFPDEKLPFMQVQETLKAVYNIEHAIRWKDGRMVFLSINATPLLDDSDNFNGMVATIEDITERKKAEEDLQREKIYLDKLFKSTPGAVAILDNEDTILKINKKFTELFGYETNEALGKHINELIVPDYLNEEANALCSFEGIKKLSEHEWETQRKHKDGTLIEVAIIGSDIFIDEKFFGVYAVYIDIRQRKIAGDALKESEEKFRTISSAAKDAIIMIDNTGNINFWNKAAENIFGYSDIEIVGSNFHDLFVPERFMEAHRAAFKDFQKTGTGGAIGKTLELNAIRKNGEEFPIELSLSSIKLGGKWNAVGIARDITDRKKAEEDLKNISGTKDKFYSIIAHDLRGPMGTLMKLSALLADEFDSFDLEDRNLFLKEIKDSSENIFHLLENLLTWSRTQKGKMDFFPEKLNLQDVIEHVLKTQRLVAANKKILVTSDIPGDIVIIADENMLNTVLRNFIGNSIKFTPEEGFIKISHEKIDGYNKVSVTDSGIGMDEETKNNLFKIEQSQSSDGTAGEKGTGLGLILCKEFVEKHGGKVWVESEFGKGSTFSFTVPEVTN